MKKFIIGSGGLAKEVYLLLITVFGSEFTFGGFIGKEMGNLNVGKSELPILSEEVFLNKYESISDIELYLGIGDPILLNTLIPKFSFFNFPNLIHPKSDINLNYNYLGKGNIITSGCIFTTNIRLNNFNLINLGTTIGHDTIIGSFNIVNPGVNISGGVCIGDSNLIGTNSTILQNLILENNSILGAGSVLTKNLPSKKLALGIPAKVIKDL